MVARRRRERDDRPEILKRPGEAGARRSCGVSVVEDVAAFAGGPSGASTGALRDPRTAVAERTSPWRLAASDGRRRSRRMGTGRRWSEIGTAARNEGLEPPRDVVRRARRVSGAGVVQICATRAAAKDGSAGGAAGGKRKRSGRRRGTPSRTTSQTGSAREGWKRSEVRTLPGARRRRRVGPALVARAPRRRRRARDSAVASATAASGVDRGRTPRVTTGWRRRRVRRADGRQSRRPTQADPSRAVPRRGVALALDWSHCGRKIAAACSGGAVCVWDV